MIRFLPDTWREMLLRPIAIAAPDAGVYIEIMAPDFRFVFVLILLVVLSVFWLFRRGVMRKALKPTALLLGLIALAFIPWLATTANGRYFIPLLLAGGPLCIALAWHLPMTRSFRLTAAIGLVTFQAFVTLQSSPFHSWGLAQWKEAPFFDVELSQSIASQPSTYVTLGNLSYSLIAPFFPAKSRWMSLSYAPSVGLGGPDSQRTQKFLESAEPGHLNLLLPTVPEYSTPEGQPNDQMVRVLTARISAHRLELRDPDKCQVLPSNTLASMAISKEARQDSEKSKNLGFWVCPVRYNASLLTPTQEQKVGRFDPVFRQIENHCPRFFAPGQVGSMSIRGGEMRMYDSSERKAYVLDNGEVFYKYYRALNPVKIGTIEEVLSGKKKIDCNNIRGRSGLPWEREI